MFEGTILDPTIWRWQTVEEMGSASWFTMSSYTTFFLLVGSIVFALVQAGWRIQASAKVDYKANIQPAPDFPAITGLPLFNWRQTEPVKHRPFKPKYHLTMADESALENLDPSELIAMDNNYVDRLEYRKKALLEHHDIVVNLSDDENRVRPAVQELYNFLMATYLPTRYPTMFRVHAAMYDSGRAMMLENLVTGTMYPALAKQNSTLRLLETLGRTLDEDLLVLLPERDRQEGEADGHETKAEKESSTGPKYTLDAYVVVCASGFNPREKLGKRLADIHEPVPGYAEKLEGSMDRYFDKLEVGNYVKRVNWTITTDAELYAVPGATRSTHARRGEQVEELGEIDVDKTYLRCERQTLHRLPKSKALVFAFKTYLYPIRDIKEEGLGNQLADAIDGLQAGNVPQMHVYKRGAEWGPAVKKYLRS